MLLNNKVEKAISMLESAGFEAFAVGGCVRDLILNREVSDFDITTSALPDETKFVFSEHNIVETGIKHGTVTVIIENCPIEITTYRTESGYSDSRHPDSVKFVKSLTDDLSRRDFTVNAIAYSPSRGIVDPFCGVEDIKRRIIRTVGEAEKRFTEDSLRILRALRFSSVLGFDIEAETASAIHTLIETVKSVSPERIYTELKKLVCGMNYSSVLSDFHDALSKLFELSPDFMSSATLPPVLPMRLTALFGSNVSDILRYLRVDNDTKRKCTLLLDSMPIPETENGIKHYILSYGREDACFIAEYRRAHFNEDLSCRVEHILDSGCCLSLKELAVSGTDLIELSIDQKSIGGLLINLLKLVVDNEIENKKELLLERAKVLDNSMI